MTKELLQPCIDAINAVHKHYLGQAMPDAVYQLFALVRDDVIPALAQQEQPVLTVECEPDYWSGGHFHKGTKSHIDPTKVWGLPIGAKLYTAPPTQPALTYEDLETCREGAGKTFRRHKSSIRGQQLSEWDDWEWHLAKAIEAHCRGGATS